MRIIVLNAKLAKNAIPVKLALIALFVLIGLYDKKPPGCFS